MGYEFCLFYKNNSLQEGLIVEERKNRLSVKTPAGGKLYLPRAQAVSTWHDNTVPHNETDAMSFLNKNMSLANSQKGEIDVKTIWELCEPGDKLTAEKMSDDFLDEPSNPWQRLALLMAMKEGVTYFKQKKGFFEPRTEGEVEEYKRQVRIQEEKNRQEETYCRWAGELLNGKKPDNPDGEKELLDDFWCFLRDASLKKDKFKDFKKFESLFKMRLDSSPESTIKLLELLKAWGKPISWGKFMIASAGVDDCFTEGENAAGGTLEYVIENERDERGLECYTIDCINTQDYDDAISLIEEEGIYRCRVYISNVAAAVRPSSVLWECAERRISSVYTLKENYPMFPENLSNRQFSLLEKEDRHAICFLIEFDGEFNIVGSEIYPALIQVNENRSYQQMDEIIDRDPLWANFLNFLMHLMDERPKKWGVKYRKA